MVFVPREKILEPGQYRNCPYHVSSSPVSHQMTMKHSKGNIISALVLLIISIALFLLSALEFSNMHEKDAIYPSSGITLRKKLGSYFSGIKNTPGDTDVYIFQGKLEGGNILILGGSHPNEPAGFMTSVLLVESIKVKQGKLVIIPQANLSGFTHNDPHEGNPQKYPISTPKGKRWFRYGSRLTNPIHQWPDPSLYINPAGQKLSGTESRNLNRSYPGRKNGNLTEKIAFGIMELIKSEKIDMAVDLHEAAPEYPVINAIVFHENSAELAALALMELQIEGLDFRLEESPKNLRGLSHREWGETAKVHAILLESANVSHGRLKGKPSSNLIIEGKDKNYVKASKFGLLFVPFDSDGIPLKQRVARHLAAVKALLLSLQETAPNKAVEVIEWPSANQVKEDGIGAYLKPPK